MVDLSTTTVQTKAMDAGATHAPMSRALSHAFMVLCGKIGADCRAMPMAAAATRPAGMASRSAGGPPGLMRPNLYGFFADFSHKPGLQVRKYNRMML